MEREMPPDAKRIAHSQDEAGTWVTSDGVLVLLNEAGHNGCAIDLEELIPWLREHRPEILGWSEPEKAPGESERVAWLLLVETTLREGIENGRKGGFDEEALALAMDLALMARMRLVKGFKLDLDVLGEKVDRLYDELYSVAKAAREERATRGERLDELLRRAEEILARKKPDAAAESEEPKP
jgi:hypothetical protein